MHKDDFRSKGTLKTIQEVVGKRSGSSSQTLRPTPQFHRDPTVEDHTVHLPTITTFRNQAILSQLSTVPRAPNLSKESSPESVKLPSLQSFVQTQTKSPGRTEVKVKTFDNSDLPQ